MANLGRLKTLKSFAVGTSPVEIDLEELPEGIDHVIYRFDGNSEDLELITEAGGDFGLSVDADDNIVSGPHNVRIDEAYTWLVAESVSTTVDIEVALSDGNDTFIHGPISEDVNIEEATIETGESLGVFIDWEPEGGFSPSTYRSTSLENQAQVSTLESVLAYVEGRVDISANPGDYFFQVWDSATGAGNGDLAYSTKLKKIEGKDADFRFPGSSLRPIDMDNGIVVALSTTKESFNAPAAPIGDFEFVTFGE